MGSLSVCLAPTLSLAEAYLRSLAALSFKFNASSVACYLTLLVAPVYPCLSRGVVSCNPQPLLIHTVVTWPAMSRSIIMPQRPTCPKDWDDRKRLISDLYWVQDKTLSETMKIMEVEHGFLAT